MSSKENKRKKLIGDEWYKVIGEYFNSSEMKGLLNILRTEYQNYKVRPDKDKVFRAFKECPFNRAKVIFVGQDPYPHDHANGIAFASDIGFPKSLQLMFREMNKLYDGPVNYRDFALKYLCEQGVLLLNTRLTIRDMNPASHKMIGWEFFITRVISELIATKNKVFIYLGKDAQEIAPPKFIMNQHNCLRIDVEHPAFASRMDRDWNCENLFVKCNEFLKENNLEQIKW